MVVRSTSSGLALPWRLCLAVEAIQTMLALEAVEAEVLEQGFQSNSSNHLCSQLAWPGLDGCL